MQPPAPSPPPSVLADMGDRGLAGLGQSKVRGQASWDSAGQDPTHSYAIFRSRETPQWKGKTCRVSRSCLNSFSCWQGAKEVLTWGGGGAGMEAAGALWAKEQI